jgi:hypothetical protein
MTSLFDDWKRFCAVLREIASGDNGRVSSGLEAQTRAQAGLGERGYSWPGRAIAAEPIAAFDRPREVKKAPPTSERRTR